MLSYGISPPPATGERSDDGDAFSAGQTNHVTISIAASKTVVIRDRSLFEWTVMAGDYDRIYTTGGARNVESTGVPADRGVSYLIEPPTPRCGTHSDRRKPGTATVATSSRALGRTPTPWWG